MKYPRRGNCMAPKGKVGALFMTRDEVDGMSPDFHRWQHLTDEYAEQLEALRHREPGASARLTYISRELGKYQTDFQDLVDLVKLKRGGPAEPNDPWPSVRG